MLKTLLDILFVIVSLLFLGMNIFYLFKNKKNAILYIYPLIFIFNVLPTIVHLIFGQADYLYFRWASIASNDLYANMIYELIIIIISISIWGISFFDFRTKKIGLKEYKICQPNENLKKNILKCMLFLQLMPIIIAMIVPSYRGNFFQYGARYTVKGVAEIPSFILGIGTIAFIFFLFNTSKENKKENILSIFLMVVTIYLRGSRAIIANVMVMGVFALLLSDKINFKKAFKVLILLIPIFIGGFYAYHLFLRDATESFYSYYSIDFSRDYTTIFSIYAQQHGIKILEYAGQSILFCLLFWLPRSIFSWKPYPFPTYITLSLLGYDIKDATYLTLRTTTNIFSESITNFGLVFGTLFIIVTLTIVIFLANKSEKSNTKLLLIYIGYEMMVLDFSNWILDLGFIAIIILMFDYNLMYKLKNKLKKYGNKICGKDKV